MSDQSKLQAFVDAEAERARREARLGDFAPGRPDAVVGEGPPPPENPPTEADRLVAAAPSRNVVARVRAQAQGSPLAVERVPYSPPTMPRPPVVELPRKSLWERVRDSLRKLP